MNTQIDNPQKHVQLTIVELLLSALELSELHEEKDGREQRQEVIREIISCYLDTVEAIESGQPVPATPPRDGISRQVGWGPKIMQTTSEQLPIATGSSVDQDAPNQGQPLHLPTASEPRKHPHYSVQSSIYALLLSALNLSEHFEKYHDFEERQRKMELVIKDYLETYDAIQNGA